MFVHFQLPCFIFLVCISIPFSSVSLSLPRCKNVPCDACMHLVKGGIQVPGDTPDRKEKTSVYTIDYQGWEERCSFIPRHQSSFSQAWFSEIFNTDLSGKDDFHLLYGHMQGPRRETIHLEEFFPGGDLLCQIQPLYSHIFFRRSFQTSKINFTSTNL